MDHYYDEAKSHINSFLAEFALDRRHVVDRRLVDAKLIVGLTVLAQPPENLQDLIAANDVVYIKPVFLPFFYNYRTKYNAKFAKLGLFLPNLSQIASTLKIPLKPLITAILGVFLLVTPTYQITHSPT